MAQPKQQYGGQAVIEGVMFGGRHVTVTAVRRKDHTIEFLEEPKAAHNRLQNLKKLPFIRGIIGIIEASAIGSKHLNFAAERYDVYPGEEAASTEQGSKLTMILGVAVVGVLSLIIGKILFTAIPAFLATYFDQWIKSFFFRSLIEGVIKTFLLLIYIYSISLTPLVKRLFQYHGAEHKVINAFEAGAELTVENVGKFSRLHYRCGSSFIIFTVIVGVVLYSFFPYSTVWERVGERILLIPVVIGIAYEILRFTNSLRDIPVLRYLGYPGLWLQKLTTKEPDHEQIEVAIASFLKMKELDEKLAKNLTQERPLIHQIG